MKRWFFLLLLLVGVPALAQTTNVSGTVVDSGGQVWLGSGTGPGVASYRFDFVPSPSNPQGPYFQGGVPFNMGQVFSGFLNGSGAFSGVAVPSNTSISPSGSTWKVTVCPQATFPCFQQNFTIGGASQALTITPGPITVNVISQPSPRVVAYVDSEIINPSVGNQYYNSTDNTIHVCTAGGSPCNWISITAGSNILPLNNIFTGNNSFVPGATSVSSINNVVFADTQAGADPCAKITNALAAGNIVNALGFVGTQVCTSGFTVGNFQTVYIGKASFTVGGQVILAGQSSHVIGLGGNTTSFVQSAGFPANTPVLQIGNGTILSGATFDSLGINCFNGTNSIGGENQNGQELSGFFNVIVQNCKKYSLWYEASGAQNSSGRGWDILPSGGDAGTIGAYIHNVPSFRGVQDATFNTNDASTIGNLLVIDGVTGGSFENIHFEHGTIGASIGPTAQTVGVTLKNFYGNASVPTLVSIANVATNRVTAQNLVGNGSATILSDALNGITDANTLIKNYDSNAATFAPYYIVGGQNLRVGGQTSTNSLAINGSSALTGVQGTDAKVMTAGAVSGTGSPLCTDALGGSTTSGCPSSGVSEATWSASNQTAPGLFAVSIQMAETTFTSTHVLIRYTVSLPSSETTCSTAPILAFKDITSNSILSSLTISNSTLFFDSGGLSVSMAAGDSFGFVFITAGVGCTGGSQPGFTATIFYK